MSIPMSLDPREQALIAHAQHYREHFSHAGAPGHNQYLLIAKLATMLEDAVSQAQVTAAVAPTTSIDDAMSAIEDIAELVGWPCFDSERGDDSFSMQFKLGGL